MTIHMGINIPKGVIYFSTGPDKTRKEDLQKWLGRNNDAILVKLDGVPDPSFQCSIGHLCRIVKYDNDPACYAYVGKHFVGQLPDEAFAFADRINSSPECLISIVGKVEDGNIYIYIAE